MTLPLSLPYNDNPNKLGLDFYHNATGKQPCDTSQKLKWDYIKFLHPKNESDHFSVNYEKYLSELPPETLQALYLSLMGIFTDLCSNEERKRIIDCLLRIDQSQWSVLLEQVCFIMPIGTRGQYVSWATMILSSAVNPTYREQLTNVANRFFKYDTQTVERGYILLSLAKLDSEQLSAIDNADEKTRNRFIETHVPKGLKKGPKKDLIYDQFQQKWMEGI